MQRSGGVLLGCALAVASAQSASAKCAMQQLSPVVITAATATLPSDGGVLVGFEPVVGRGAAEGDPSRQPTWKFTSGTTALAVTTETLAPGLTVYRPSSGSTVLVSDAQGERIAAFTRDGAPPKQAFEMAAPKPVKLRMTVHRSGRGVRKILTATLSAAPPPGAVAVIMYAERDKKRVALSFGRVTPPIAGMPTVVPWQDPNRCAFNPDGMVAPLLGEHVTLAWVDGVGRVSKLSAPVLVVQLMSASLPQEDR